MWAFWNTVMWHSNFIHLIYAVCFAASSKQVSSSSTPGTESLWRTTVENTKGQRSSTWPCHCSVWWKTLNSSSLRPQRWEQRQPACAFQATAIDLNLRHRIDSAIKFWQFLNVENNLAVDYRRWLGPQAKRLLQRCKLTSLPCWMMTHSAASAWPVHCLSSQDCLDSMTPVWERRRAWRCCISSAGWCIKSCQETQNHSGYQSNVSPMYDSAASVQVSLFDWWSVWHTDSEKT